jgi:hypothetical protein
MIVCMSDLLEFGSIPEELPGYLEFLRCNLACWAAHGTLGGCIWLI